MIDNSGDTDRVILPWGRARFCHHCKVWHPQATFAVEQDGEMVLVQACAACRAKGCGKDYHRDAITQLYPGRGYLDLNREERAQAQRLGRRLAGLTTEQEAA